jgi:hypothetical protein
MTIITPEQIDECYRCGYDLRGIASEQACPECGLLAERSRRVTDELHESRPKWLRALSIGIVLILLSAVAAFVWRHSASEIVRDYVGSRRQWAWAERVEPIGFMAIAMVFFGGVFFFTRREGYPPADSRDRWFRRLLRLFALLPFAFPILQLVETQLALAGGFRFYARSYAWIDTAVVWSTVATIPLPLLLLLRLRSLAKRARSAHLAEHCIIVGVGTMLAAVCIFGTYEFLEHYRQWGFGEYWLERSKSFVWLGLIPAVLCTLFVLWWFYLMTRFAIAFMGASRKLSRQWKRDDRSVESAIC